MHRPTLALALAVALLAAGCIGKKDAPEETLPVATPPAEEPASTASTESASEPAAAEAPPSNASSGASPGATTTSTASAPAPPPAPPQPKAWNLSESTRLGWAVAAGLRAEPLGQAAEQGQKDPDHCPDAVFTLPAGTLSLELTSESAPAKPGEPEAGAYRIVVTAPDGNRTQIEPPQPSGPQMAPHTTTIATLLAGPWTIHAEPVGPSVAQVWEVSLAAKGSALAAPTTLALAHAC